MIKQDISLVLAVYNKLDVLKSFLENNTIEVPLVISCLGSDDETQDYIKSLQETSNGRIKAVTGRRSAGRQVSFSENWNAAINAVETSKMVLIHNDLVLGPDFLEILDETLTTEGRGTFVAYTTVEPSTFIGHVRPGKIIGEFGTSFENFDYTGFSDFCKKIQEEKKDLPRSRGYGFFLSGWTCDFQDVGGFDFETFTPCFCEDDDLSIRNRIKGYKTVVDPRALAFHFVSLTSRGMQKTPTTSEVNINRKFARKWGFEARYLWETGYEYSDKPLRIFDWDISLRVSSGLPQDRRCDLVLNFEPLLNRVVLSEQDLHSPTIQNYILTETQRAGKDLQSRFEVDRGQCADIDIYLLAEPSYKNLTRFLGGLRFAGKLKPGEYEPYPWLKVVINKPVCEKLRTDSKNYLFLQKEYTNTNI